VQEHSIDPYEGEVCGHDCQEAASIVRCFSDLISATVELIDVQHGLDPTTWPLSQVLSHCQGFIDFHPTVTVHTLVGGVDVAATAIAARVRWERNE
jgi:hypothetical protein